MILSGRPKSICMGGGVKVGSGAADCSSTPLRRVGAEGSLFEQPTSRVVSRGNPAMSIAVVGRMSLLIVGSAGMHSTADYKGGETFAQGEFLLSRSMLGIFVVGGQEGC